jgi:hypothetical protein
VYIVDKQANYFDARKDCLSLVGALTPHSELCYFSHDDVNMTHVLN